MISKELLSKYLKKPSYHPKILEILYNVAREQYGLSYSNINELIQEIGHSERREKEKQSRSQSVSD